MTKKYLITLCLKCLKKIICSNVLGSCKGTTGPASINPETGKEYGLKFPIITIQDMVNTEKKLIRKLKIWYFENEWVLSEIEYVLIFLFSISLSIKVSFFIFEVNKWERGNILYEIISILEKKNNIAKIK